MVARIGEHLVELGALAPQDLDRGLAAQHEHGGKLGHVLSQLGLVSEVNLARALSRQLGLRLAEAKDYPSCPLAIESCSVNFLKRSRAVPIAESSAELCLAMADPLDRFVIDAIRLVSNKPVSPWVGTASDIDAALEQLYGNGRSSIDLIIDELDDDEILAEESDVERLRDMASEAPVIRLVNLITRRALEQRASDIHIESFETRLSVRLRVDGMLREIEAPPRRLAPAVISRIKIMAKLNIAERRRPQDGRIRLRIDEKEVDLRVSTVPSLHGEHIVMRLLERTAVALEFPELGLAEDVEQQFQELLAQDHGIVLVTGPTGSGKTTTLYTVLGHLDTRDRKIITVEDPVEYDVEGVTQIPVNGEIGLNFANALRSIVRQDPDIIMIGEMRDLETAEIAVQSALTGHLVLSTLHTNNAPGAITRLLDMGIEDYLLTSTVSGAFAQRLVRALCTECRVARAVPRPLVERLGIRELSAGQDPVLYQAVGCESCQHSGYRGRLGIFELLTINDDLRDLILAHASHSAIERQAKQSGMRTMFQDGLLKALAGKTTLEEVRRVTKER